MGRKKADAGASTTDTNLEDMQLEFEPNVNGEDVNSVPPFVPLVVREDVKKEFPSMEDPEWTNYVMKQFQPNELDDGHPKVNGLRRVLRKLIGPIVKGKAEVKQSPLMNDEQRATVEYTVVVMNKYQLDEDEDPYFMEFTDAADGFYGNIDGDEFKKYPVANASTRAQVRALRCALGLYVVAKEELSQKGIEALALDGKITENQITKLDIKCEEFDINLLKFINIGKRKFERIGDVPRETAIKMFGLLTDYQRKVQEIPEEIRGYNSQWRNAR